MPGPEYAALSVFPQQLVNGLMSGSVYALISDWTGRCRLFFRGGVLLCVAAAAMSRTIGGAPRPARAEPATA